MELKTIVEAALFTAPGPLKIAEIQNLFAEEEQPERDAVRVALAELAEAYRDKPIELKEVASGYRFQVRAELSPWISRLFEEKPARYSKAYLETLAIIAYRQPVTRGEIEEIRGVAVSTQIIRGLLEREWAQVVGHKEVPGRPALYATTPQFLDSFNLKSLSELPPLHEFLSEAEQAFPGTEPLSPAPLTQEHVETETAEPGGTEQPAT
jgi:segregation and condensation protein B